MCGDGYKCVRGSNLPSPLPACTQKMGLRFQHPSRFAPSPGESEWPPRGRREGGKLAGSLPGVEWAGEVGRREKGGEGRGEE